MNKLVLLLSILSLAGCAGTDVSAAGPAGQGFLSSVGEVRALRRQAENGDEPQRRYVAMVLAEAVRPWPYGSVGTRFGTARSGKGVYQKRCVKLRERSERGILSRGGHLLYAKSLAYNLTGNADYAKQARGLLLAFARSSGFDQIDGRADYGGANQCAFDLGQFLPLMIDSAIMLESFPGWSARDKLRLQKWLAGTPYRTVAAIARTRKNNWGTAAAFAGWAIAHYLIDSGLELREVSPRQRRLSPAEARQAHLGSQLNMMGDRWRGDSRCGARGIREDGGMPDELRRGSTGCDGTHLRARDGSYDYQITSIAHLVYHAEAVRRHMDDELFSYPAGEDPASIQRAIDFVIDNSDGVSQDWKRSDLGVLRVASHAYSDRAICEQLERSHRNHIVESIYIPYTKLLQPADGCRSR